MYMEKKIKGIIAVNNLGYIGKDNGMIWRSKDDFIHFKKLTLGTSDFKPNLLVGYNTFQGLPLLKNRNIVKDWENFDVNTIDWCIGGRKTYEKYCHLFTELHISHINDNSIGDTIFPDFSKLNPDCKIINYYFEISK